MTEPHQHVWLLRMHLDGCHHYGSVYHCDCGAIRDVQAERQLREGYGSVWALDDCERCRELLAGARRRPRQDYTLEAHADRWHRTPKAKP
jgi:hypothetical protein